MHATFSLLKIPLLVLNTSEEDDAPNSLRQGPSNKLNLLERNPNSCVLLLYAAFLFPKFFTTSVTAAVFHRFYIVLSYLFKNVFVLCILDLTPYKGLQGKTQGFRAPRTSVEILSK